MPYEIIDHTADLGIRVTAADVKELFKTAGHAMFEQITDLSTVRENRIKRVEVTGVDIADLMINWLRALFSIWTLEYGLAARFSIRKLTGRELQSHVFYDIFDPKRHEIKTDIKAVTYSGISVEQTTAGWEATVIFDI